MSSGARIYGTHITGVKLTTFLARYGTDQGLPHPFGECALAARAGL